MKKVFGLNYLTGVLAGLVMAGGLLTGCDPEEPCIALTTSRYKIGFFELKADGNRVPLLVNFDSVYALGSDSLFYRRKTAGESVLELNLNAESDTSTFVFKKPEQPADTLQLTYIRSFRLISPECGLEVRFTRPEVIQHTFDSVRVLTEELSRTTKGVDLEIYN